jgi:hypothetical protein
LLGPVTKWTQGPLVPGKTNTRIAPPSSSITIFVDPDCMQDDNNDNADIDDDKDNNDNKVKNNCKINMRKQLDGPLKSKLGYFYLITFYC